ncbi:hypothetical protein FRB96_003015 [Tulasnella sp. 330]|nr:hypothetical protein FRB96_003015 [Tulasnella sp. 330]
MASDIPRSSRKASILKVLTFTQHLSAPFISTFMLIHLSAPVIATLGGSTLSSQVMLLGREYYQTSLTEPLLVYGPIAAHISASTLKRILLGWPKHPSILALSAYPLLALLPIHVLTHRINPSIRAAPILSLSPSELDYEYIKYGLQTWPLRSTLLYAGLVVCGITHGMEGSMLLSRVWMKSSAWRVEKWKKSSIVMGGAMVVMVGVLTLGVEPLSTSKGLMTRFHAAWTHSIAYQI